MTGVAKDAARTYRPRRHEHGIIGAAAGVGLTVFGWSGRFVEFSGLRDYGPEVKVRDLEDAGMMVLPVDRNVVSPAGEDVVETGGWLRPRLWGGQSVRSGHAPSPGRWFALGKAPVPER